MFCNLRFHEVYNSIRQAVKKMEWNWKSKMQQNTDKIKNVTKYRQKANKISFMCGCMRVYMGVGVCVSMWMRVYKLSQARNLKRWL